MADVAVVAHSRKSFGGGLPELRRILAAEGVTDPLWYEVTKSRRAPEYARQAAARGADVVFVWGGDGTVQRCVDALIRKTEILWHLLDCVYAAYIEPGWGPGGPRA